MPPPQSQSPSRCVFLSHLVLGIAFTGIPLCVPIRQLSCAPAGLEAHSLGYCCPGTGHGVPGTLCHPCWLPTTALQEQAAQPLGGGRGSVHGILGCGRGLGPTWGHTCQTSSQRCALTCSALSCNVGSRRGQQHSQLPSSVRRPWWLGLRPTAPSSNKVSGVH